MSYIILTEKAFVKMLWFRKNCHENNVLDTKYTKSDFLEVSLMGISQSEEGDGLLTVEDFVCVPQECSTGLTEPTDDGMAIYFEEMMLDKGISPNRCGRIWAHTHPGVSPAPSGTDEETFSKWFKDAEFAAMYIMAEGDDFCKIKHTSKHLGGMKTQVTPYVLLSRTDASDKPMFITTKFAYETDKLCEKMKESFGSFVTSAVFEDYSHLYEEWMVELKRCVKKKSYGATSATRTTTTNIPTTIPISNGGLGLTKKEQKKLNKIGANKGNLITMDDIIIALIKNKKNTLNEFQHAGINQIAAHFKVDVSKVHMSYSNVLQFEKYCTESMVEEYISHLIVDGKNAIETKAISEEMLIQICTELSARPAHISEIVDDLLIKAASNV